MDDDRDWWLLLPSSLRELPADLAATLFLVGVTAFAVFVPVVSETPLRIAVGLPFVLFVPGYALIAALFPEAGEAPTDTQGDDAVSDVEEPATESAETMDPSPSASTGRGIDGIERVALSFGLSIAVVPLIGLVLNFTPWGIRLVPIVLSVSAFTAGCVAVAARRRWALPEEDRFRVPYRQWMAATRTELFDPDDRLDAALNVVLVLSILLATASIAYAVAVPKQGETFTEFYLLTENESGDLVADDYPTNFTAGESEPLVVGIGNQEHERVDYTVVVQLQRIDRDRIDNRTRLTVQERQELRRLETTLGQNETWQRSYDVTPRLTGQNLRLAFLLYRDSVPATPTVENAYRETHLWVNVSEAPAATSRVASPSSS